MVLPRKRRGMPSVGGGTRSRVDSGLRGFARGSCAGAEGCRYEEGEQAGLRGAARRERFQLLAVAVVADADDRDLGVLLCCCAVCCVSETRPRSLSPIVRRHESVCLSRALIVSIRSWTPPRSPPDIPSTSSMMSTWRIRPDGPVENPRPDGPPVRLPNDTAVLVTSSLTRLLRRPPMPPPTSFSALLRASLAFTSTVCTPSSRQMIVAALVLPMPGGPEMSTARFGASLLLFGGAPEAKVLRG